MDARDTRRLSLAWIGALVVLATVAGASCWLAIRDLHATDDTRLLLAVSRQRMLSQRVALLSQRFVAESDEYVRLDLRWELRASATEILDVLDRHLQPVGEWTVERGAEETGPDLSPLSARPPSAAVLELYNAPPVRLKHTLIELAGLVHRLSAPSGDESPAALPDPLTAGEIQMQADSALTGLDRLLEQLELEHVAAVEKHVSLLVKLLVLMLVALLAAGIVLAWPELRRGRAAQAALRSGDGAAITRLPNPPAAGNTPAAPPRSASDPKTA